MIASGSRNHSLAATGLALCGLLGLTACESVPQDEFASRGGISPDPTAILEGSIIYSGPRPECVTDERGQRRVRGRVVLSLYFFDNPPFPEGRATTTENLLIVPGDALFEVEDCNGAPGDSITRSAHFNWPRLTLRPEEAFYQIRGFYDHDEDFNPLFSVTRVATAGDIMGAAVVDVGDPTPDLQRIRLPPIAQAPHGEVLSGITVVLAGPALHERPVFRLNSDGRRLASDAPFPALGADPEDPRAPLYRLRALTCAGGEGDGERCGLRLERLPTSELMRLSSFNVQVDSTDPQAYGFAIDEIDLMSVAPEGLDSPGPDGVVDPHPILGPTLNVDWYTPMVTMTRLRMDPNEVLAGIPNVRLFGSVLGDGAPVEVGTTYGPGPLPVVVPPMAIVEWTASSPTTGISTVCRVPYVAQGTPASVNGERLTHCGELPTGQYEVSVFAGVTGASGGLGSASFPTYQSWTVPNELGNPSEVGPTQVIASQSREAGSFVVHGPAEPRTGGSCEAQAGGVCGTTQPTDVVGLDGARCLPQACCEAVQHLCGLPLCAGVPVPEAQGRVIRGGPTTLSGAEGDPVRRPDCVPFEMPRQCCGRERSASR